MPLIQDVFSQYGAARFTTASGEKFSQPALLVGSAVDQRLIARKRPGVSGAPIDNQGADPDSFDLQIYFANGHRIADVPDPSYPAEHARFYAAARRPGGTWTVYVPGRGEKRVQVKHVASQLVPGERDSEVVILTLWEDTEDERITAAAFSPPNATVQGPSIVRSMAIDGPRLGVGGSLFGSVSLWADALESTGRAPLDAAEAGATMATRTIETAAQSIRTLSRAPDLGAFGPLADADTVGLTMQLVHLQDAAARQRGAGLTRTRIYPQERSIFEIALAENQDPAELITLNARLPSLFSIPPGTPVRLRNV